MTPLFTVELNQLPARVAPRLVTSAQLVDAHAVSFAFNAAIDPSSVTAGDLQIINLTTGQTTTNATAVTRSGDGHTLTFTLPPTLADGNYRFRLAAGSILNTGGLANASDLDAAGDTFILAGDANRDRTIDFADLLALARSYGRSGVSYSQGDFNSDGKVDFSDLLILARHYGSKLAAPPVITAPLAATASTRRRVASDLLA